MERHRLSAREKAEAFAKTLRSPDTFPMREIMRTKMDWAYAELDARRQRWMMGEGDEEPMSLSADESPEYLPETEKEGARICKELYAMGYVGVAGTAPKVGLGSVKFWFKGRTETVRGSSITSADYADDYIRHIARDIRA